MTDIIDYSDPKVQEELNKNYDEAVRKMIGETIMFGESIGRIKKDGSIEVIPFDIICNAPNCPHK